MYSAGNGSSFRFVIDTIIFVLQYALLPVFLYHFVISIFGWVKRKETAAEKYTPVMSFAIVIAAHNEAVVIGSIVRNLRKLNYPTQMYDIFVIADNCTDKTADIAKENGAFVHERFDDIRKGKGFALQWMFERLFKMDKQYDAVCVLDADNLVSSNYLMEMNKQLCMGHKVIQGYLDSKNPFDSIISGSYSITYWVNNRLFQLPRHYLGLCCAIGGTGFVVATDVLKKIGWDATCLTEDLEFTLKLVLKGYKVKWSHEAVVYDEKPIKMAQSWKQRKRWMQGQSDCACRYLKSLLAKAWKDKDMVAFDCALYVIQPLIIVASGIGLIINLFRMILFADMSQIFEFKTLIAIFMTFILTYWTIIFISIEGKLSGKVVWYFILFPFYNLTWIPIIIQGYIGRGSKEWVHTDHTRSIDIADIERLEKVG